MLVLCTLLEPYVSKLLHDDLSQEKNAEVTRNLRLMIEDQMLHLPSQKDFSNLMTRLTSNGYDLVNHETRDIRFKIAGLAVLDCLLDVSDEIVPERRIQIAEYLRQVVESDKLTIEAHVPVLRAAATSIGHFARNATPSEIEFLQNSASSHVSSAFRLLSDARSESKRLSGALVMTQLAIHSPSLIFAKRKELFRIVWDVISDRNPVVRGAAAEVLLTVLQLISQRESMAEYIAMALQHMERGFAADTSEKVIGSLLIADIISNSSVVINAELQGAMRDQNLSPQVRIVWLTWNCVWCVDDPLHPGTSTPPRLPLPAGAPFSVHVFC